MPTQEPTSLKDKMLAAERLVQAALARGQNLNISQAFQMIEKADQDYRSGKGSKV